MDVFALISFTVAAATLAYAASLDERLKKQTKRIEQLEKQLDRFDKSFDSR